MEHVEAHEIGLRSLILERIGNFTEDDVKGEAGRRSLAESLKTALNTELEALEGFGGIEKVHFTSFVLQ
jgi:flagellar FliL protein